MFVFVCKQMGGGRGYQKGSGGLGYGGTGVGYGGTGGGGYAGGDAAARDGYGGNGSTRAGLPGDDLHVSRGQPNRSSGYGTIFVYLRNVLLMICRTSCVVLLASLHALFPSCV
jgi:hypothetical protein